MWALAAACALVLCFALFFYFFYDFLVKNSLYTEGPYFSISITKLFKFIPFLMFLLEFYCLKANARTVFNLSICFFCLIFGFFRLFIFYFFLIAGNGCAHDVPPRWAFVRWLLRRHVRERSVVRCLFLWPFSLAFFMFF